MFQVLGNGAFELGDTAEDTASDLLLGEIAEEALDEVEPGGAGGREMEMKTGMFGEPGLDLGVLVGGVVVHNQVQLQRGIGPAVEMFEKAQELAVAVAWQALAHDLAGGYVQGGKQRRSTVALVVVGHRLCLATLQRQTGLGTIERLDLTLLVDREHDGPLGRVQIQAHHIAQLRLKLRIARELEAAHLMRLETGTLPYPVHRARRKPHLGPHPAAAPVRRPDRTTGGRQRQHLVDFRLRDRRLARPARLIPAQPLDACLHKALAPTCQRRIAHTHPAHDLTARQTLGTEHNHLRPLHLLVRRTATADPALQFGPLGFVQRDLYIHENQRPPN